MIDIHCHMLFGVDDGPSNVQESLAMLEESAKQGITDIILTPHYRHGMFPYQKDKVDANFIELQKVALQKGIRLYLGCEYHVNSDICSAFDTQRCHTLADKRYVLAEYSGRSEYSYICQMTRELMMHGYIPVIAHVERYGCMVEDPERAAELRKMGAWIQVNADAVLGLDGHGPKKYCKRLLQNEWVDVIASDSHDTKDRVCHLEKCYQYISKKYDADYAELLLQDNPAMILK